ncbi:serine/threonine-protein phosphatase 4 regulatory subunit 2 [Octopus sinensis]|uniref:Serine/threonine-protein phosphatase 4 regulatory subunit 2 n=1 Tax=Octopus sinensis TaxID=2607531 RepID=A0A6P7SGJ7_9MOLL|nr:serine/threonine-protein phosphatase 4 regulatory subunit 2 [Octopus sinensis]
MAQDVAFGVRIMEDQEAILDALTEVERKANKEIPPILDQYLLQVAKTGETLFPWPRLKPLFVKKLDSVMQQFNEEYPADHLLMSPNVKNVKFEEMRNRIINAVNRFHGAPFTIQRLCELITEPTRHYKRSDKFLRGIEKNIMVVSTVDPYGRKVVCESRNIVNGIDINGHTASIRTPPHTPPPLPVPSPPLWQATSIDSATIWPSSKSDSDKPDSPTYDENCDERNVSLSSRTLPSPPLPGTVHSTDLGNNNVEINNSSIAEDKCDKEDSSSSFDSISDDRDSVQSSTSSSGEESTLSSGDDNSQQSPTSQNGHEESTELSTADSCANHQPRELTQKDPPATDVLADIMQLEEENSRSKLETKMEDIQTQPASSESSSISNSFHIISEETSKVQFILPKDMVKNCDSSDSVTNKSSLTTNTSSTITSSITASHTCASVPTNQLQPELCQDSSTPLSSTSSFSSQSFPSSADISETTDVPVSHHEPTVKICSSANTSTSEAATVAQAESADNADSVVTDIACTDNSVSSSDEMTPAISEADNTQIPQPDEESKRCEEDNDSNEASSVMETNCCQPDQMLQKEDGGTNSSASESADVSASTTSVTSPQVPESNTPDEEPMEL